MAGLIDSGWAAWLPAELVGAMEALDANAAVNAVPTRAAFACRPSASIACSTARPAAQLIGFAP